LLLELSNKYTDWNTNVGTDKSWPHSYIQNVYEAELAPYQHSEINLLEIGVSGGYSLKVWSEYFTKAMIYGLDINLHAYNVYPIPENVRFVVGDGTKPEIFMSLPKFKIIIDDGSHYLHDQLETFKIAFPLLEPGGLFIIEDIQDLEEARTAFEQLNPNFEIFDLREKSGRADDIIFLYRT
jgi:SAM-dependent methyltransferase